MMIKFLFSAVLLSCVVPEKREAKVNNEMEGFAVVELFTSEGCSSCPPADRLFETVSKEYAGKKVLMLSYHVDYWDKLGWKDEFATPENTGRQGYYANLFRLNSIYTPQAVVNGKTEFVGSDRRKMLNSIHGSNKINKAITIKAFLDNNKVTVNYKTDTDTAGESLLVALVQKDATSEIKRGENAGKKLHHINVVRQFHILKNKDNAAFQLAGEKNNFFIIALLQNDRSGFIEGYATAAIK